METPFRRGRVAGATHTDELAVPIAPRRPLQVGPAAAAIGRSLDRASWLEATP